MKYSELIPLFAAVVNLLLAVFVLRRDFKATLNRVYFVWGMSIFVWNLGTFFMFEVKTDAEALFWARFLQFGVIFLPISLFHLSLLTARIPIPRFLYFLYGFQALLALSDFTSVFIRGVKRLDYAYYSVGGPVYWLFVAAYSFLTFGSVVMLARRLKSLAPLQRSRVKLLLLAQGILIFFGNNDLLPILGIYKYPGTDVPIYPLGSLAAIFYGVIVGYSVLQHQLLDIHVTLSRVAAQGLRLIFALLLGFTLLLVAYQFCPPAASTRLIYFFFGCSLVVLMLTVVLSSLFFPRLFGVGTDKLERRILGDRFEYHDKINSFIQSLPWYSDYDQLLDDLHDMFVITIQARSYQLVLLDEHARAFTTLRGHPEATRLDAPEIVRDSPVFQFFRSSHADYLPLGASAGQFDGVRSEQEARKQLHHFEAEFAFPFFADEGPVGLLLLGRKTNGEPYTPHDLHLFTTLVRNLNLIINQLRLKQQVLMAEEMELLGRMSRGMAHDLNNLITPVWTFLQLVREGLAGDGSTDELLPTAIRNVEAIRQYVKESLFYSTTFTPHLRQTRLDECALKAVNLVQPQLRAKNIAIRAEQLPAVEVEMDFVLIQRLLCNLLANACDASPPGSSVEVRILPLATTEAGRDWYRLLVVDHGEGISRENLKHVFRPYFTTKDRGSEKRGFGLGLAICRKIVHLHGGNLSIESQPGKGTTVIMDLPSRQQEKPALKTKPKQLVPT